MSISGAYLEGVFSGVAAGGLSKWTASTDGSDKLDRTSGSSLGFTDRDIGARDMTVNVELRFDTSAGVGLLGIGVGALVSNLLLYRNGVTDAAPAITMPLAIVLSTNESVEVRGQCTLQMQIGNKGPFTENIF